MKIVGVITGDFVSSTQGDDRCRREMLSIVQNSVDVMRKYYGSMQLEFFRGDSFQILVKEPERALHVAVLIRAALCARTFTTSPFIWDARMAIGIGEAANMARDLATSTGDAFLFSGRTLDAMKVERLALKTYWTDVNKEFYVSNMFADDIISHWTIRQADLIFDYLLYNVSQRQIALNKGMTTQNVNRILKAAKAELIINYLHRFKEVIYDRAL